MKEYELIFNNQNCINLGLVVAEYPTIPQSNEDYESTDVDGRNGSLTVYKGTYRDKKINFKFNLLDLDNYDSKLDLIDEWLNDIEDNKLLYDRLDRCYRVKRVNHKDIKKQVDLYGEFEVEFTFEPFMEDLDLTTIETTADNFEVYYSGNMKAETLFKVYGSGNIQLTVNGETMQINNVVDYVEIDSKLLQARNADGTSKDDDTLGDFALLTKGNNIISWTGTVNKIQLEFTTCYR